jgi:hypothetical protein
MGLSLNTPLVAAYCTTIQHESELYNYDASKMPTFSFKGRTYEVIDQGDKFVAQDKTDYSEYGPFAELQKFLVDVADRIVDFSLSSREERLSAHLLASKQKHFRVDVDKTLLYRAEKFPEEKNKADFEQTFLYHTKYGQTEVFVNKEMLEFLKKQAAAGASVSITSTGGWADATQDASEVLSSRFSASEQRSEPVQFLAAYLKNEGVELKTFQNKKTFNENSYITIGLFQKYRVLGDQDREGKLNIMIDDQWHQRAFFDHSIHAEHFGMG